MYGWSNKTIIGKSPPPINAYIVWYIAPINAYIECYIAPINAYIARSEATRIVITEEMIHCLPVE